MYAVHRLQEWFTLFAAISTNQVTDNHVVKLDEYTNYIKQWSFCYILLTLKLDKA